MVSSKIKANIERPVWIALASGIGIFLLFILAGTCVATSLITKEKLQENSINLAITMISYTSALAGTLIPNLWLKRKIIPISLLQSGCYITVLFLITAMLFNGEYSGIGRTCIAIVLGSISAIMLVILLNKGKKMRRGKRVYR